MNSSKNKKRELAATTSPLLQVEALEAGYNSEEDVWFSAKHKTKSRGDPYAPYSDEEDGEDDENKDEIVDSKQKSTAIFEKKEKPSSLSKSSKHGNTMVDPIQFQDDRKTNKLAGSKISV